MTTYDETVQSTVNFSEQSGRPFDRSNETSFVLSHFVCRTEYLDVDSAIVLSSSLIILISQLITADFTMTCSVETEADYNKDISTDFEFSQFVTAYKIPWKEIGTQDTLVSFTMG